MTLVTSVRARTLLCLLADCASLRASVPSSSEHTRSRYGFAITLLVVSLDVPRDFTELANRMRGFLAFAIGFIAIWLMFVLLTMHAYRRRDILDLSAVESTTRAGRCASTSC